MTNPLIALPDCTHLGFLSLPILGLSGCFHLSALKGLRCPRASKQAVARAGLLEIVTKHFGGVLIWNGAEAVAKAANMEEGEQRKVDIEKTMFKVWKERAAVMSIFTTVRMGSTGVEITPSAHKGSAIHSRRMVPRRAWLRLGEPL